MRHPADPIFFVLYDGFAQGSTCPVRAHCFVVIERWMACTLRLFYVVVAVGYLVRLVRRMSYVSLFSFARGRGVTGVGLYHSVLLDASLFSKAEYRCC